MEVHAIQLRRANASLPWGFRLQGGADFATPLSVQVVQPDSIAARAGLCAGDGVLRINQRNADLLEHEDAKREILESGNGVDFLVQRGAVTTWKPKVTPIADLRPAELQINALPGDIPAIQRTSLAANKQESLHIGSSHNRAPRPFQSSANVSSIQMPFGAVKTPVVSDGTNKSDQPMSPAIIHAQYNTPLSLYSAKNVTDSFSQQAEAARSSLGINVSTNLSEVEFRTGSRQSIGAQSSNGSTGPSSLDGRSVQSPVESNASSTSKWCYVCGGFINGVFVRVKGHTLHGDCLRCHRCRLSLKNIGYFWVNENIYCEQHARDITRPAGGGYTAYVIDVPNEPQ